RLGFLPQRSQRPAAQEAQDARVAPVGADPPGTKLAFDDTAFAGPPPQRRRDDGDTQAEAGGDVVGTEWAMSPGIAGDDVAQGIGYRRGEGLVHAAGHRDPQSVAQPPRVFDARPDLTPCDTHEPDAPQPRQLLQVN